MKFSRNEYLPFRVHFFFRSVRVHVVVLVLLVTSWSRPAQVQVVRVLDAGADSHLVG